MLAMAVVALLCAGGSGVRAYPVPQDPNTDQLKFNFDGPMLLMYQIKAERTGDFEALWAGIRAGLGKSTDDSLKAFAQTLQLYKVKSDQPGGPGVYIFRLDPPSKQFTYNPVKLLFDNVDNTNPQKGLFTDAEARELYKKFDGSYDTIRPLPLVKVGG